MLKLVLVYLQGSGGNLIARTLSLSEKTIPYVPATLAKNQATLKLTPKERLTLYNNWSSNDWENSEKNCSIWYHHGLTNFLEYEKSNLWLIDTFHPTDFIKENRQCNLWENINQWDHRLLIDWSPQSLKDITFLAKHKRKDLKHEHQINHHELTNFNVVKHMLNFDKILWEDMVTLDSYVSVIKLLDQQYNLNLDYSLVKQLWSQWDLQTKKLIYERS